jgi:DNA-binding NarL/FixJ family response regulator
MSPLRTLIIEDSPLILANLTATLEELADVEVVGTAADEAGALKWIRESPAAFDMMIVDIFLNSGTGLGVLREASAAGLPAKRVVLTNYASDDMRARCRELGADRVFDKSSELEELIAYCSEVGNPPSGVAATTTPIH